MKKAHKLIFSLVALLALSFSTIVFAANSKAGFEFSSDDLGQEVMERVANGETKFSITREFATSDDKLGNEISVNVWITKNKDVTVTRAAKSTETVNWALSGRYYFKSNDETVSNYGNHGSVDYNGSSLSNAVWDVYHDVTNKYSDGYKATATDSAPTVTNGKKFIGKYRLKNTSTNKYSDDAEIYIIVKKDGDWNTKGNYSAINID